MFKEYGIRLDFIPTIMPHGAIRLQVAPEVSALDFADAVTISGFTVPAITDRRVKTEVELQDGQSFAIGGLLDNNETETFQKIPFLGDIPILGKFFQSMQRNKTNTELIVIVTPEIVCSDAGRCTSARSQVSAAVHAAQLGHSNAQSGSKDCRNTPAPPPATIPVEKLIDSMKPETPLSNSIHIRRDESDRIQRLVVAAAPAPARNQAGLRLRPTSQRLLSAMLSLPQRTQFAGA